MTLAMWVTILVVFVLALLVIGYSIFYRKQLPVMNGMTGAMALGMIIGLLAGAMLGTIFGSHLLISTVWSMLIGLGVGFLSGCPIGGLAMMDGMLSGLMGGMMGAMIGAMLPTSKAETLIRILFVVFVGIMILLIHTMKRLVKKEGRFFGHPLVIAILFVAFFAGYNQLGPLGLPGMRILGGTHESMPSMKTTQNIVITATEFSYDPKIIRVQRGMTVNLTLVNIGNVQHDLEIQGLPGGKVYVKAAPGEKGTMTFKPKEKGTYSFFCTIPGHKEMLGKLVVD